MDGQIKEKLVMDGVSYNSYTYKSEEDLDFLDYRTIILKYWKLFEKYFKVQEDVSTRLKDIYKLGRNPVMHCRPITKQKFVVTNYEINWFRTKIQK